MAPTIRLAGVRRRLELGRQRRRLTRILGSARSLPGYRDRLASWSPGEDPYEALARLPVLERSRVQDDPDAFRDARVDSLALTSSGSTGTPLALRLDRRARWRRRRQFGLFFLRHGWLPWRSSVSVKVVSDPSARLGSGALDRTVLARRAVVSVLDPPERQFESLRRADPEILHGLPSALEQIALRAEAAGWRPSRLRRIFTASEALPPPLRELLERALGAPVIDSYAASEALVGWECAHRRGIHVLGGNVVLEVLGDDGEPAEPGDVGHVVITTLDNRAMPLLRYAIGDLAIAPRVEACPCGRRGLLIPRVLGRRVPLFEVDDDFVSPWGMIARMYELRGIGQFQLVQEAPNRLAVLVRPDSSGVPIDREGIVALAAAELGDSVRVEVREVASIEASRAGKAAPALVRERAPVSLDDP
jgi:phenylacetate-CoA ligase